jgi:hypothetical protein
MMNLEQTIELKGTDDQVDEEWIPLEELEYSSRNEFLQKITSRTGQFNELPPPPPSDRRNELPHSGRMCRIPRAAFICLWISFISGVYSSKSKQLKAIPDPKAKAAEALVNNLRHIKGKFILYL